jgi:predicted ATPase
MTIEFTPLTVLIGANSSGKSTVLQAIDFLRSAAIWDIPMFLNQKEWVFPELKSQLNIDIEKPIEFSSYWEFDVDGNKKTVNWYFSVNYENDKWFINEKIESGNKQIIYNNREGKYEPEHLKDYKVQSSVLKVLGFPEKEIFSYLQIFLYSSNNYELFSPEKMRLPNKNIAADIGRQGMTLASFIQGMPIEIRKKMNSIVSDMVGIKLTVDTVEDPSFGLIFLFISEELERTTNINSRHISDGLLRIIAFVAFSLQEFSDVKTDRAITGIALFDEIENGINPYITEKVLRLLKEQTGDKKRQILVTTHSPIMVDDIAPEEIVFLWKDGNGGTHNRRLFDIKELQEMLEFLNPGEAWMNIRQEELLGKMDSLEAGK